MKCLLLSVGDCCSRFECHFENPSLSYCNKILFPAKKFTLEKVCCSILFALFVTSNQTFSTLIELIITISKEAKFFLPRTSAYHLSHILFGFCVHVLLWLAHINNFQTVLYCGCRKKTQSVLFSRPSSGKNVVIFCLNCRCFAKKHIRLFFIIAQHQLSPTAGMLREAPWQIRLLLSELLL